jgi:hypothetical protein
MLFFAACQVAGQKVSGSLGRRQVAVFRRAFHWHQRLVLQEPWTKGKGGSGEQPRERAGSSSIAAPKGLGVGRIKTCYSDGGTSFVVRNWRSLYPRLSSKNVDECGRTPYAGSIVMCRTTSELVEFINILLAMIVAALAPDLGGLQISWNVADRNLLSLTGLNNRSNFSILSLPWLSLPTPRCRLSSNIQDGGGREHPCR